MAQVTSMWFLSSMDHRMFIEIVDPCRLLQTYGFSQVGLNIRGPVPEYTVISTCYMYCVSVRCGPTNVYIDHACINR